MQRVLAKASADRENRGALHERSLMPRIRRGQARERRAQARLVNPPDGVDPVVDQDDRDLLRVGIQQRRVVEDRQLLELDLRVIGEHALDHDPRVVAQMAAWLAEEGQSGHAFRL